VRSGAVAAVEGPRTGGRGPQSTAAAGVARYSVDIDRPQGSPMTDPAPPGPEPGAPNAAPDARTAPEPDPSFAPDPSIAPESEPEPDESSAPDAAPDAELEPAPPGAVPQAPVAPAYPWPSDTAVVQASGGGPRRLAILGYLGAVVLGAVIGAAGLALATGALGGPAPSPSPVPTASPSAAPTEPPAGNAIGRPDAPVTVEVWADYQCPFCRLEDLLFGGAVDREYVTPGIARIVYRDFAILGQESTDAAVAARCAGAQDPAAQLRYHDALYTFQQGENQGRFARANLVQIAEITGVPSQAAFTACLDDPAVAKAVADETAAGRDVGVTSTPTIGLRGPGGERVLTGFNQTWPKLRDALEAVRVAAPVSPSPAGSAAPSASAAPTGSAAPSASASPAGSGAPSASASPAGSGAPSPGRSATPAP